MGVPRGNAAFNTFASSRPPCSAKGHASELVEVDQLAARPSAMGTTRAGILPGPLSFKDGEMNHIRIIGSI
jgi:hypothetical protein